MPRPDPYVPGLAAGGWVLGPVRRIAFPTAGAPRQVEHGLATVPDGFLVARTTGAVYAIAWDTWTEAIAVLEAPVANTLVEGRFFTWAIPETPAAA